VIHPSALMADGLSTLLLILGPERAGTTRKTRYRRIFVIRADTFVTRTSPLSSGSGGKTE
jgi:thiamine biosynthesis lipoprotein